MLDREEIDVHHIKVIISRLISGPPSLFHPYSVLDITIKVQDVNDNPPVFERSEYGVGITTSDGLGKELVTVVANDLDINDTVSYSMIPGSLIESGTNLQDALNKDPFKFDDATGVVTLNFIPQDSMSGYFLFRVKATDGDLDHDTETRVKIFIIAETNRVSFIFLNTEDDVRKNEQFVSFMNRTYTYLKLILIQLLIFFKY